MILLSNLNLSGCELQNAVIQNLASAPSNPKNGQLYYDTVENKLYLRQNGAWVVADGSRLATSTTVGGILIGYTPGEGVNNTYAVQLDSNGAAFVSVPWSDTVTRVKLANGATPDVTTSFQSGDITLGDAAGKNVTDNTTDVALTTTDQNLPTGRTVAHAINKAIADLDMPESVGGDGKYIKTINETDGIVTATADDLPTYAIEEQGTAAEGYLKTYKLKKTVGSTTSYVGDAINIPKDFVVKSATLGTVTAADKEAGGKFHDDEDFKVGDKYIDLEINTVDETATSTHLYINVTTLIDIYTAGDGINVNAQNVISLNVVQANGLSINASTKALELATVVASTNGAGGSNGAMTAAQAEKLAGVEDGAQANIIESVEINGTELTPDSNKKVSYSYKFADTITGDGTTTAFTINHGLATTDIVVSIFDGSTNEQVWTDVVRTDANNISVRFANAPTSAKTYRVVVIK